MKKLLAGILAAALFAGALWIYFRRDAYLARAVRSYGSAILGVKVSLRSLHLDVAAQSIELNGLTVGNPAGYKSRMLLQADLIRVSVDVSTLASDVISLREITVLRPEITYEKVEGVSNLDAIQRNADSYVRALQGTSSPRQPTPGKRWLIDELFVRDARVVVLQDLVLTRNLTVAIPLIHLREIGRRTNGATTAEATRQVMAAITKDVGAAVGRAVVKGVGTKVEKGARGVGKTIHGFFGK